MGTLFDLTHILYILVSLIVSILILFYAKRYLIKQKHKDFLLKTFGLLTFFLHVSVLWVDFLNDGSAGVPDNVLFPIYFCNASMYLLLLTSLWTNKGSKVFNYLAIITAYSGFFGATISLFYPAYYLGSTSMFEWGVLKSMLSHTTMWIGSVWLLLGGYFKIERKNVLVYFIGLLIFGMVGIIVNLTFDLAGLYAPNAMYLQHPPLDDVPLLSAYTIAFLMTLLIFLFTSSYQKIQEHMV
jgi:hypothetical protein